MSKRNRLDRQKALEKEKAKQEFDSNASKRFMNKEPLLFMLIKLIMLASFFYSGFFYGGVTVVGVYTGAMLIGILLMFIGLVLVFLKRYIVSFILSISGVLLFLYVAYERVIKFAAGRVSASGDLNPQTKYMLWYYPIAVFAAGAFAFLIIKIVMTVMKNKRIRKIKDNAPTKSIIDE